MGPPLRPKSTGSDSSILFKVTIRESTLLAGRPTTAIEQSSFQRGRGVSFAVVQVLSNTLIMFQSIENPDASGTKTLHISVDNVSSLVNTDFSRVSPDQAQPMIGPTGAELRVVYSTENFGCVVSQDLSLDCDALRACMTPSDLSTRESNSRAVSPAVVYHSIPEERNRHRHSCPWRSPGKSSGCTSCSEIYVPEEPHSSFFLDFFLRFIEDLQVIPWGTGVS
jgi:hypothetical protein